MKKQFKYSFLFLIILVTSIPVMASDYSNPFCGAFGFGFFDDLIKTMASSCIDEGSLNNKCKCLRQEMKNKISTQNKIEGGFQSFSLEMDKQKSPYKDQFDRVYKKLTVQVAAQEVVLNLPMQGKFVGCTAQDMSVGISKKLVASVPKQIDALKELQNNAMSDFENCKKPRLINLKFSMNARGCDFFSDRARLIDKKIEKIKSDTGPCKLAMNALKSDSSKDMVKQLLTYYELNPAAAKKESVIYESAKAWNKYLTGGDDLDLLKNLDGKNNCSVALSRFDELSDRNNLEQSKLTPGASLVVPNLKQCASNDSICKAFETKNNALLIDELKNYSEDNNECITYAEYVTSQGAPGLKALEQFANAKNPEDLLNNNKLTRKNIEIMTFLQANPLIALVAKGGNKSALGTALKKMAKNVIQANKKGKAAGFRSYLDFMKNDFATIYKNDDGASTLAVCEEMSRNYVAIEIANDLPLLDDEPYDEGNYLKKTDQVIRQCIGKAIENTGTTKLKETLDVSPIYALGVDTKNTEPTKAKFEEFKKSYCDGFAMHKESNCSKDKDMKDCRASFKPDGEMNQNITTMKDLGLKPMTIDGARRMASRNDETKQNTVKKIWWHKEIGSKLSQQAIAGKNDHGEFATAMQENEKVFSSPDIQSRYENFINPNKSTISNQVAHQTPSNTNQDGFSRSSEDSDQVNPEFSTNQNVAPSIPNFRSIPPEQIRDAKEITKLDPSFESRTDENQLATYRALKKNQDESGITPDFDVSKKIEELEELEELEEKNAKKVSEIQELKKEINEPESKDGKVAQIGKQNGRFPASFNQTSFSAPISNSPIMGQFPRISNMSGGKITKGEASYQAALLQKYQMSSDLKILVQGNNAEGPYIVAEKNIIIADDVHPFKDLKNPYKLSEFLAVKLGGNVENGESIKILDPKSNDYFVMKATKKDGILSYQLIPFVPKNQIRMATLGGLKNEIDIIKK